MSKEQILNYEVQMIDYKSQGLSKPDTSLNHQYTTWQLNDKIVSILGSISCNVRWIGNHQSAYMDAFVYILLSLSKTKESFMLQLKEKIYQLSRKYLSKSNQKLIVQFVCLMQYTHDKYNFLKKYPQVIKIIVSILKFFQNEQNQNQIMKMSNFILQSPVKQIINQSYSIFSKLFNFINISQPNDFTYKFECGKQCAYVIVEKDCFFIVQKNSLLTNQNSAEKINPTLKYSTPRFCGFTNSIQKPKSQKKINQKILIHKNKKSQNLLDHYGINNSAQCSLEQIYNSLNRVQQSQKSPRKLQYGQYRTQNNLRQHYSPNLKKRNKKKQSIDNQNIFIQKQLQFQLKRRQHWLKLQRQYYEKKKQIHKKIKQQKNKLSPNKIKQNYIQHQEYEQGKLRKMSFNSFTGNSTKDKLDSQFGQTQYDRKSNTKSHQGKSHHELRQIRERKISFKQSPTSNKRQVSQKIQSSISKFKQHEISKKKKYLKKKNKNRLSVIQQENRIKFWNFNNKNNQLRSPKIDSVESSNRQTIDPNILVTFHYVNKNPQSSQNISSSINQDIRYYAMPVRV